MVFDLELQELVGDLLTDEDKAAVEKNLRLAFATHKTKNSENPVFVKERVTAGWNITTSFTLNPHAVGILDFK